MKENSLLLSRTGKEKINIFNVLLGAILFLGVLPFNKATLTLFASARIGEIMSYALCGVTALLTLYFIIFFRYGYKTFLKHKTVLLIIPFIVLNCLISSLSGSFALSRLLSIGCLFVYYIFSAIFFDNEEELLLSIGLSLSILIVLSIFLYVIDDPNVQYKSWASKYYFKGVASNRNSFSEIALFDIAICFYFMKYRKFAIGSIFIIALCLYGIYLAQSATSIVCAVALIGLLTFNRLLKFLTDLKVFLFYVIICGLIFLIVINFNLIDGLADFLNKSGTFNRRTGIWDYSISLVKKNPFLGYGYDNTMLLDHGFKENDPHNGILYIMLTQGLLGLFVFAYALYVTLKDVDKYKDNPLVRILFIYMIIWATRSFVESGYSYTHFVFWVNALIIYKVSRKGENRYREKQ